MRVGLVALLIVGCSPRPAPVEPARNVPRPAVAVVRPVSRAVADSHQASAPLPPELELGHLIPDFHDELRWPLSSMSHPELAPRFDVAKQFAQPGVGWLELCERGVHNRITAKADRDQLDYLRGWCSAIKGDVDTACSKLAPLRSSPVLGLSPAVRIDLVNILADHGGADRAEHWINRHRIHDPAILDALAATYFEIGNPRDAHAINALAMETDDHASAETACRRLVRHIVLGNDADRTRGSNALSSFVKNWRNPDPECARLYDAVECWRAPGAACADHLGRIQIDSRFTYLLETYQRWPRQPATQLQWIAIAETAVRGIPMKGSEEATLVAYETALAAHGSCGRSLAHSLRSSAYALPERIKTSTETKARVAELVGACKHTPRPRSVTAR